MTHPPALLQIREDRPKQRLSLAGRDLLGLWGLSFDAASGRLRVREGLPLLTRRRGLSLPFSSLREISLRVSAEGSGPLRLDLSSSYQDPALGEGHARLSFRVRQLDRHEEALDLAFRIAQILGWPWYSLRRKDEQGLELELSPQAELHPHRAAPREAVPEAAGPADYRRPVEDLPKVAEAPPVRPRFQEPAQKPLAFDPATELDGARAVEWRPGERVRFFRPRPYNPVVGLLYLLLWTPLRIFFQTTLVLAFGLMTGMFFIGLPVALVAAAFVSERTLHGTVVPLTMGALGLVIVIISLYVLLRDSWSQFKSLYEREVIFDWEKRELRLRLWRLRRSFRFEELRGLTCWRYHDSHTTGKGASRRTKHRHWAEVELSLPGLDEVILRAEPSAYAGGCVQARSAMIELARALDLPWREAKGFTSPFF